MRRVTYATMILAEGDTGRTVYGVFRCNLHGRTRRRALIDFGAHGGDVEHVASVETMQRAQDVDHKAMAAIYATPQAPAFDWTDLP